MNRMIETKDQSRRLREEENVDQKLKRERSQWERRGGSMGKRNFD